MVLVENDIAVPSDPQFELVGQAIAQQHFGNRPPIEMRFRIVNLSERIAALPNRHPFADAKRRVGEIGAIGADEIGKIPFVRDRPVQQIGALAAKQAVRIVALENRQNRGVGRIADRDARIAPGRPPLRFFFTSAVDRLAIQSLARSLSTEEGMRFVRFGVRQLESTLDSRSAGFRRAEKPGGDEQQEERQQLANGTAPTEPEGRICVGLQTPRRLRPPPLIPFVPGGKAREDL
jgi:hypothetical protein